MNYKKILVLFCLLIAIVACNKDDDNNDNFDAAAQALIDDETLIEYLKSHYYLPAEEGEVFGIVDTIMNNETSLYDALGDELKIQEVTEDDIDYNLYYYTLNEGVNDNPTRYDSIFVKYRGFRLDSVVFDESTTFNSPNAWLTLTGVIQGWKYGFPNFKSGVNSTQPNEPITYDDTGKGILFMPSGLAYGNIGTQFGTLINEPLIFHIELAQVVRADSDNDGVLNMDEDLNTDGEVNDEDTDEDTIPNYFDTDDDGDGVLTRNELESKEYVINIGEDDPTFALNEREISRVEDTAAGTITINTLLITDSNNDGTPDYLDPDTN